MKNMFIKALVGAVALMGVSTFATASTLEEVKAKGFIQCGVSQGLPGFSTADEKGNWSGMDVDVCRGMSSAIFGVPTAVKYTPLSAKVRFTALQSGEIDVLSRNTTWTATRDNSLGLDFTTVNYYDGQGFMVRKSLGVKSALELDGATICTNTGTTTELNVEDYFRANGMTYKVVAIEKADEVVAAYDAGRCDVYTTDRSGLAANRGKMKNPAAHVVLPETISKEPLGPVVRHGDNQWGDIVKWTLFAMVNAEEMGISSQNIDGMAHSKTPATRRFLGLEGNLGQQLGLPANWAAKVVRQVGNYGEVYERNITPLGLSRGVNALWNKGGVLYAPPMR